MSARSSSSTFLSLGRELRDVFFDRFDSRSIRHLEFNLRPPPVPYQNTGLRCCRVICVSDRSILFNIREGAGSSEGVIVRMFPVCGIMTSQYNFFDGAGDQHETAPKLLQGFRYRPEMIGSAEEETLIGRLRKLPFKEFDFHGYKGKRRVVSFGWQYDFSGSQLRKADDVPEFLLALRKLAASFAHLAPPALQHVLVTEYGPGAGIGWHRDKVVFGEVVGISLLAPWMLRFRRKVGQNPSRERRSKQPERLKEKRQWQRVNVLAEPRSAYHLSGPARSEWEHSILRVDQLRYSITFRNVLED
jgi:alkylated DNA repair dioxygenase AlkB